MFNFGTLQAIQEMITENGQEALEFEDVLTEVLDISRPVDKEKITLKDLINW